MESELKRVIQKQAKATLESCSYGNTSQSIRSFLTQQKAGGRNEFDFDWDQDQSFSDLHNVSQDPEVVNNKTKLKKNINPFGISSKKWVDEEIQPKYCQDGEEYRNISEDVKLQTGGSLFGKQAALNIEDWD